MHSGSFVTQLEPTIIAEPRQRSLDYIARFAQAASVRASARGQQADDHHPNQHFDDRNKSVTTVALQSLRFGAILTVLIGQMRKLLEHRFDQFLIPLIGGTRLDHERDTVAIANNVAFTAIFATIRGIRAAVLAAVKGSHRRAVDNYAINVQNFRFSQGLQQAFMNFIPDTSLRPFMKTSPTRAVTDTEFLGQQTPRNTASEDVHYAF